MPAPVLSGAQKRHLRGLAHHLSPVVQVGREGVSEAVVRATDRALLDHELIKVKLLSVDRDARRALAESLGEGTEAAVAGLSGRVLLLYRPHPDEPVIRLPR